MVHNICFRSFYRNRVLCIFEPFNEPQWKKKLARTSLRWKTTEHTNIEHSSTYWTRRMYVYMANHWAGEKRISCYWFMFLKKQNPEYFICFFMVSVVLWCYLVSVHIFFVLLAVFSFRLMKLYSLFDSNVNKSTEEKTELAQEYGGTSSSTIVMFNLPLPKNTHETHICNIGCLILYVVCTVVRSRLCK